MNYQDFHFQKIYSKEEYTNTVKYLDSDNNEYQIKVKKYLPLEDKLDLIQIALQKAQEQSGYYNELKLDIFFHLNIIYLYTDIDFKPEDKENEYQLYDILQTNGIINLVVQNGLVEDQYNDLIDYLDAVKESLIEYKNSAAGVLKHIVTDLPKNAAAAKEIVDSFDPQKYKAVTDFAIAANGGRDIKTNIKVDDSVGQENKVPVTPQDHLPKKNKVVAITSAKKKD